MRILHLLNWPLKDISYSLDKVASQKFDAIQINPLQPLKEDGYREWWMSYQPCGFQIGNVYGSKDDLLNLCEEASRYNIKIISDVVCNHMAESSNGYLEPHDKVDVVLKSNPDFWKERKNVENWNDRNEVISRCMGLPSLNLANHDLQDIIISFLNELIDCGVMGFRFDAAKSIALPEEGNDFWPRVIYCLKKYGIFLYGEVIFADKGLIDKYSKYMSVLTNGTGSDINKLVGYVENHDTYLSDGTLGYTKKMPSLEIAKQYAHINQFYPNTLFYARPYDDIWKDDLIRRANLVQPQKVIKM